ncbi:hypothetical protein B8V81_2537 [Paenibacillus pasadenensis]|uniref:Uncharacterized protein n=1 Tax=Paenibacillus pasadenensis TaxID=217090 RepID=A0A2N5N1B2_9BACL|nr:hypothetical protein B8V81_2537 [Paenibacillus pasadenensis]
MDRVGKEGPAAWSCRPFSAFVLPFSSIQSFFEKTLAFILAYVVYYFLSLRRRG